MILLSGSGIQAQHIRFTAVMKSLHPVWVMVISILYSLSFAVYATGINNTTKTFTAITEMSRRDWDDRQELQRVWQAALVRIPMGNAKYLAATIATLPDTNLIQSVRHPTVIYLHGCSGVWQGTHARIDFLAGNGYAVIAPVSFARAKYPQSCDPYTKKAGLYRGTLKMRQHDANYTINKASTLTWVDLDNLFLMGFSQGGIVAATLDNSDASLRARIVEGWSCHSGWSEYKGINAPPSQPVLTLVGANDPWFQNPWTQGECSNWLHRHNGSLSIVYTDQVLNQQRPVAPSGQVRFRIPNPLLSRQHSLLDSREAQETVLQFLRSHIQ